MDFSWSQQRSLIFWQSAASLGEEWLIRIFLSSASLSLSDSQPEIVHKAVVGRKSGVKERKRERKHAKFAES